jgi:hypothetical protein
MSKLFKIENIIEICYKFIYLHQIMVSQVHGSIIGKALRLPLEVKQMLLTSRKLKKY